MDGGTVRGYYVRSVGGAQEANLLQAAHRHGPFRSPRACSSPEPCPPMKRSPGKSHYEVLQVDRKASREVIQGAYRALMKNAGHHPDLGGSSEQAQAINEAFSVLNDPETRAAYDRALSLSHPALDFQPPVERTQYILICPHCRKRNLAQDTYRLERRKCGACGKTLLPPRRQQAEHDHARAFRMGLFLFEKGLLQRALSDFQTAVRLEPRSPQHQYWLGRCHYQLRHFDKARQAFQAASTLQTGRFHFFFWLGQSHYALKQYGDAAGSFAGAHRLRPRHTPTVLRLASCLVHLEDLPQAMGVLEGAVKHDPRRLQLHTLLGVLRLQANNPQGALEAFHQAEKINPDDPLTRRYLARIGEG